MLLNIVILLAGVFSLVNGRHVNSVVNLYEKQIDDMEDGIEKNNSVKKVKMLKLAVIGAFALISLSICSSFYVIIGLL